METRLIMVHITIAILSFEGGSSSGSGASSGGPQTTTSAGASTTNTSDAKAMFTPCVFLVTLLVTMIML